MAEKVRDGVDGLHFRVSQPREPRRGDDARDPRARPLGPPARRHPAADVTRTTRRAPHAELFERLLAAAPAAGPTASARPAVDRPTPAPGDAGTPRRDARPRRGARGAAPSSALFVNLLHLALPLYTIQIYDRVISSGSIDTLVALTVIVVDPARLPGGARLPAPPHLHHPRRPRRRAPRHARCSRPRSRPRSATAPAPRPARCATSATCAPSSPAARSACRWTSRSRRSSSLVLFMLHPLYGIDRPDRRGAR